MTCQRCQRCVILIFFECNAIYVKDIKDRSSTLKGCNAMYVKDGKRTYTHIFAHNFLNIQLIFGKLRLRPFQPYHQILCILKHIEDVEDVEDRSSALKERL